MKTYDLIVIGTGAANIVTDGGVRAGKRVAVIERGPCGGTCLNHGCIPTKVLCTVADIVSGSAKYERLGIRHQGLTADWAAVRGRVLDTIYEHRKALTEHLQAEDGPDFYRGTARFIGEKEILVEAEDAPAVRLTAETIVIATGGRNRVPSIDGLERVPYLTAESFFEEATFPERAPRSVLLVGGGPIGVEFAHIFAAFGADVTIVQRNVRLVPKSDAAMSEALELSFKRRGIKTLYRRTTTAVEPCEDGVRLTVSERETGETEVLEAELLFFSAGVESQTELLDPAAAGIATDERGWIPVNEYLETNVPGIYALGDVNGLMQLRHKANYEAEILWHNLYLSDSPEAWRACDYRFVPYVTYSAPQIAQVGLTEEQAVDRDLDYEVSVLAYSETAKGEALGYTVPEEAFVKVILEKETEKMLGVHIVGSEASLLIQGFVYLMQAGADSPPRRGEFGSDSVVRARKGGKPRYSPDTASAVTQAMTAHPSLGEVSAWAFSWNRWDRGIGQP